jgi:hypothetical protein
MTSFAVKSRPDAAKLSGRNARNLKMQKEDLAACQRNLTGIKSILRTKKPVS